MEESEDKIIPPIYSDSYNEVQFEKPQIHEFNNGNNEEDENNVLNRKNIITYNNNISTRRFFNNVPIKPLNRTPTGGNSPVGDFYADIKWQNGFENWNLVRFSTPMDGNCLFHAITNSYFLPYRTKILNNRSINRLDIIMSLRRELSEKLALKIDPNDDNSPRHYDILNGGNTKLFCEYVPEFTLNNMQKMLNSNNSIGYGYMEFIGNALNKDIYILEAIRQDIYHSDELSLSITGNRNSIVLYYMNGHYELVGIQQDDETFNTYFSPDHSFIQFLYSRVQSLL